ncbi:MAG: type 2 isopentenyl-diphosphate Delta-isomerase [Anaerolineales bacterium]|nr:type 2 isopentenyl-diphosphate Delta-isomerase [Anaerolineales bacterium]TEU00968.1 MAG: type 2 isopentenyl-diphosphate Delta-isomerase [Anaerolineales bacterium]
MSKVTPTSNRKSDHILINLNEEVQSSLRTGLERYHFVHNAIPEIDLSEIDLQATFMAKRLDAPLLISSMTGGTKQADKINVSLAEAAQEKGIAMGAGSQRAVIEEPALAAGMNLRQYAPDILLFANLGAVQLNYGYGIHECERAVEMLEADALILHLNPLQEALQPEGDTRFAGLLEKISDICRKLPVPVIVKEVGWGLSKEAAVRLVETGVAAIDVAGAGGTSWSQVEMHRTKSPERAAIAAAFIDWGIPTADAIIEVREALPDIPLIASGGLRSGIEVAKCLALGADLGGMAGPLLKAAIKSTEAVIAHIEQIEAQIRLSMFATGAPEIPALRSAKMWKEPSA